MVVVLQSNYGRKQFSVTSFIKVAIKYKENDFALSMV